MTRFQKILLGLLLILVPSFSNGQVVGLTISLNDKTTKYPLSNKKITVTINDTLVKTLQSDSDGILKPILLPDGGNYKIRVDVSGYKTFVDKKVRVDGARGRHLMVALKTKTATDTVRH